MAQAYVTYVLLSCSSHCSCDRVPCTGALAATQGLLLNSHFNAILISFSTQTKLRHTTSHNKQDYDFGNGSVLKNVYIRMYMGSFQDGFHKRVQSDIRNTAEVYNLFCARLQTESGVTEIGRRNRCFPWGLKNC